MKERFKQPHSAPVSASELLKLAKGLESGGLTTMHASAGLHALAMARCKWVYTRQSVFSRWVGCKEYRLGRFMEGAKVLGIQYEMRKATVFVVPMAKATPPYIDVPLPLEAGSRSQTLKLFERLLDELSDRVRSRAGLERYQRL